MPISFYVAIASVVAIGMGVVAYVWLTTRPNKRAQLAGFINESDSFAPPPPVVERRRPSGPAIARAGR